MISGITNKVAFPDPPHAGFHFSVTMAAMSSKGKGGGAAGMIGSNIMGAMGGGKFHEVSGLSVSYGIISEKGGTDSSKDETSVETINYAPLILKRGMTSELTPFTLWCQQTFSESLKKATSGAGGGAIGQLSKYIGGGEETVLRDLVISLLDPQGIPVMVWLVFNAHPVKWEISPFRAMHSEIVEETIELKYEKFEMVPVPGF